MDRIEVKPEKTKVGDNKPEIFNINLWSRWFREKFDDFVKSEPYHLDDEVRK